MVNEMKDDAVELCRDLIKVNSVTGKEGEAVRLLSERMKVLGFDEIYIDKFGSLVGRIKGSGNGRAILLDGHIDTVDVFNAEQWCHPPFEAEISDGRIYGRGAADMKGALAAMTVAAGAFAKNERPAGDIYVSATVREEVAEGLTLFYILNQFDVDLVIIGEATELNLNIGQRGRAEVVLETFGQSAHSSNPEKGVNAVLQMMKLLQSISNMDVPKHELLGSGIMTLTDIISAPYPGASVIPERCTVTLDRRLLTGEDEDSVLDGIRDLIQQEKTRDPKFDAKVSIAGEVLSFYTGEEHYHKKFAPAWLLDKESQASLIEKAVTALQSTGLSPSLSTYKFCTNGSASCGVLQIPTLGFGPCAEWQAHVVDEYIEISQLHSAVVGYHALIKALAN